MRIKIYDAINPDRLLGSIRKPSKNPNKYWRLQTCQRISVMSVEEMISADSIAYDIVELEFGFRVSKSGWNMHGCYKTYAKLKHLMHVRDFRLPGESDTAASYRWHSQ